MASLACTTGLPLGLARSVLVSVFSVPAARQLLLRNARALHTSAIPHGAASSQSEDKSPALCIAPKAVAPPGPYSRHFPDAAWSRIAALFPYRHSHPTLALNVSIGEDHHAAELEHRGFQVISVPLQPSPSGLGPGTSAGRCCLEATAELEGLDPSNLNRVDMVSFLHAMHLLDSDRAVQAAYRHLKPEGRLVVAWNDRDRRPPFGRELEIVLASYQPAYQPSRSYRGFIDWAAKLQQAHLFELREHSAHPFLLRLHSPGALIDALEGLDMHALTPAASHRLRTQLTALMDRRFAGKEDIWLPLETKLFVFEKVSEEAREAMAAGQLPRDAGLPPHAPRDWAHHPPEGLSPEQRCIFCGSPVEE